MNMAIVLIKSYPKIYEWELDIKEASFKTQKNENLTKKNLPKR